MAASPVLVDSCWYITQMKRGLHPLRTLESVAQVRDIATCGIVRAEVARGIREEGLLKKFRARWDVMLYVPTDNKLWADAEQLAWELDRRGVILPLTDIIIACCARRIGAVVLTFDKHFSHIPGIRCADRIV
jgi:predicted nucleic acid-binding protein